MLRQAGGVEIFVISREENPTVARRCEKLGIGYKKGVQSKADALQQLLAERKIATEDVVFLGNDTNDLPCFPIVGFAVAVADSHPDVLQLADLRLSKRGGLGAVRELCDLILQTNSRRKSE
jgi:N-acylneuraminate cytidylyltransferase